jgi:hypothetical protein
MQTPVCLTDTSNPAKCSMLRFIVIAADAVARQTPCLFGVKERNRSRGKRCAQGGAWD